MADTETNALLAEIRDQMKASLAQQEDFRKWYALRADEMENRAAERYGATERANIERYSTSEKRWDSYNPAAEQRTTSSIVWYKRVLGTNAFLVGVVVVGIVIAAAVNAQH